MACAVRGCRTELAVSTKRVVFDVATKPAFSQKPPRTGHGCEQPKRGGFDDIYGSGKGLCPVSGSTGAACGRRFDLAIRDRIGSFGVAEGRLLCRLGPDSTTLCRHAERLVAIGRDTAGAIAAERCRHGRDSAG